MSPDRELDGRRIGELLSSELTAREDGPLSSLSVVDAVPDAEPSVDGTFAYGVAHDDERVASVYLQEDRIRVEFNEPTESVRSAAESTSLRVRPRSNPPGLLVFVTDGAGVKRLLPAFESAAD
ncbi:hypothetical protein [Halocatena halophila]|uniref:hypothetical protein n=1 Tax=Halocatena halophila TaxID=2814576 RepID=UPI002ED09D71